MLQLKFHSFYKKHLCNASVQTEMQVDQRSIKVAENVLRLQKVKNTNLSATP